MTFRHQSGGAVNNSDIQQLITTLEQLQDNRVCEPRGQSGQEGQVAETIYHRADLAIQFLRQLQDNQTEIERIRTFANKTPEQIQAEIESELFDPPVSNYDSNKF